MCGIIGMIQYKDNGFDWDSKNAMVPMLLLNSLRGAHSTGLFGVTHKEEKKEKPEVEWVKRVGAPHYIFHEPEGKKFFDKMYSDYHVVIGHGRYATTGKVNAANAHPFTHDNITLVHNGAVRNLWKFSVKGEKMQDKFEVDSDALTYLFAKEGVKETLKEVVGALALIWYDSKTKCIHAYRNTERPLQIALRKDTPGIYFSSESATLNYIAERFPTIKFHSKPLYLEDEHIYTFPLGEGNENKYSREKIKIAGFGYSWPTNRGRMHHSDTPDFGRYGDMDDLFTGVPELQRIREAAATLVDAHNDTTRETVIPFNRKQLPALVAASRAASSVKASNESATRMSEITKFGIKFKVGQKILFWGETHEPINIKSSDPKEHMWYVHGTHVAAANVAVACHYQGDLASIKDDVVMVGTIHNILYTTEKNSKHTLRVYVKELEKVSKHVEELVMESKLFNLEEEMKKHPYVPDNDDNFVEVTVKGNIKYPLFRFEQMIEKKCARCKGEIRIVDAPHILPVEEVHSATDKEKKHGGFYCPDCVIHHISN